MRIFSAYAPVVVGSFLSLSPALGGCSPKAPVEHLVWARTESGATVTYRIDEGGRRIDRVDGIRIATSEGEWRWITKRIPVATDPCDLEGDATSLPAQPGYATSASLIRDGRERREQIVVTPDAVDHANEIRHDVALAASLGPYLFVEDSTYVYACGAHGNTTKRFIVWDAERDRPIDVLGTVPDPAGLVARASSELHPAGALDGPTLDGPDDEARVTEVRPVLRGLRAGPLPFEAQVTVADCYACSDGSWGSYARSVRLPSAPPRALAARAEVPEGVARFAQAHPDLAVGGWSSVAPSYTAPAQP
ncbi:MAG: hypothetical protein KF819_17280 [Labilithrix sp.]|nr:hypothetical protein [Labilithrix sp.]